MVESDNEPIRLSYQRGSHYNSIVDPYKATIGVGLGLPSYNPGSADRQLISDAVRQSEELHIEQVRNNCNELFASLPIKQITYYRFVVTDDARR